jgi:hypothetical protein
MIRDGDGPRKPNRTAGQGCRPATARTALTPAAPAAIISYEQGDSTARMHPMEAHIFWATLREPGMEHLHLTDAAGRVVATSVVLGVADGGAAFHLAYQLRADSDWRVRACDFRLAGAASHGLRLSSDGAGHWADASGARLAALDGCLDIDITVTPFTNTLPMRRLALAPGESREILVAYVSVPELTVRPVRQRYTHLTQTDAGATWRYEGLESGFRADLAVDADGVVRDYPGIWRRVG